MAFDRTRVSMDIEKTIITLFIASDDFLKQCISSAKPEYFESPWSQTLFKWISEHFEIYGDAPKERIQDIFSAKALELPQEDATIIEAVCQNLSELSDKLTNNIGFYVDRATTYFRNRSLSVLAKNMQMSIDNGHYDAAEKYLVDFRKVSQGTSTWEKPSDFGRILVKAIEREEDPLFHFNGELGKFIGPLQRRWLVFFMAPPKRGKSNFLVETVATALTQGLKVAVFSHEMSDVDWVDRFISMMSPGADVADRYPYPVFDCLKNAQNDCGLRTRVGFGPYESNGILVDRYRPCMACRGDGTGNYEPCVAQRLVNVEQRGHVEKAKMAVTLQRWFENNLRFVHYAPYSASVLDVERDLDRMEFVEHFVPDIIVDDYIGAHICGDRRLTGRDVYDFEARHMKRLADSRNCLFFSAFQGTRNSIKKRRIDMTDTGEDIRMINHCDKALTINQTDAEKHAGIIRIGKAADRHMTFVGDEEVTVLQKLDHGRIVIDSHYGWVHTVEDKLSNSENS